MAHPRGTSSWLNWQENCGPSTKLNRLRWKAFCTSSRIMERTGRRGLYISCRGRKSNEVNYSFPDTGGGDRRSRRLRGAVFAASRSDSGAEDGWRKLTSRFDKKFGAS